MNYADFEKIVTPLGIAALIAFMGFIIWDLAKQSKAGRFGTIILFIALGLGLIGFIIKTLIQLAMEGG
jgi:hypothetical protein